jgi:hypothetical protein
VTSLRHRCSAAVLTVFAIVALGSCTSPRRAVPGCEAGPRLGLVAQAVRDASYIPCIRQLSEGWSVGGFQVRRGGVAFTLDPNRSAARPVKVEFHSTCDVTDAIPIAPHADGVRTSMRLEAISPRYSGTITDVFPGGCVSYRFDFARGPHIALMEDLTATVDLYSRRQLRLDLRRQLGVELDP